MATLVEWDSISADFSGSDLLLGNGFSVRMWSAFRYGSLFGKFLSSLPAPERPAYQALGSENFEFLLENLGTAISVNNAFSIPANSLETARGVLRDGLIEAIHNVHPEVADVGKAKLSHVADSLDLFNDVFTTNYDGLLYHIIMILKDRHEENPSVRPYNDYFWHSLGGSYLEFMGYQNYPKYRHVYYLHGALFLFRRAHLDLKLRRSSASGLTRVIGNKIKHGEIPLFVSEGRAEEKLLAISRSRYLRFANDALREPRELLVVYGSSLGASDEHIAQAVESSTKRVAVSVHTKGKSKAEITKEMGLLGTRLSECKNVVFFDADTLF